MDTHLLGTPCDICGDVGYGEAILTCSICGARQHAYCQQKYSIELPEVWLCEKCVPEKNIVSPRISGNEDIPDSNHKDHLNFAGQGGFTHDSGRHNQFKRQKVVETGKVKYLAPEEVIRLTSEATKVESPLNRKFGYGQGSTMTPKWFTSRVKQNPRFIPQRLKCFWYGKTHLKEQEASVSPAKEYRCKGKQLLKPDKEGTTCQRNVPAKEVKISNSSMENSNRASCASSTSLCSQPVAVRASIAPTKRSLCNEVEAILRGKVVETASMNMQKVINESSRRHASLRLSSPTCRSGRNSGTVVESKKSNVQENDLLNILPGLRLYRCHCPALKPIWNGGFKFSDAATQDKFYDGFQAQPPRIVHRKAYEFSQTMPRVLLIKLLPRRDIFANLFQNDYPAFTDIALYLYPAVNVKGSKENLACLFRQMETEDSVMSSYINGVELLIFTSKQLDVDSRVTNVIARSSSTHFLCGVFLDRRSDLEIRHSGRGAFGTT